MIPRVTPPAQAKFFFLLGGYDDSSYRPEQHQSITQDIKGMMGVCDQMLDEWQSPVAELKPSDIEVHTTISYTHPITTQTSYKPQNFSSIDNSLIIITSSSDMGGGTRNHQSHNLEWIFVATVDNFVRSRLHNPLRVFLHLCYCNNCFLSDGCCVAMSKKIKFCCFTSTVPLPSQRRVCRKILKI